MLAGATGYYSASAAAKWGHDVFLTRAGDRVKVTHVVSNLDEWADLVEAPYYSDAVCVGKVMTWIERQERQGPVDAAGSEAPREERTLSFVPIAQDNSRRSDRTTDGTFAHVRHDAGQAAPRIQVQR